MSKIIKSHVNDFLNQKCDNPYKLWKYITELKGIMFFFDVFFIQKKEYGINYSEINKVLMSKRLYEREY